MKAKLNSGLLLVGLVFVFTSCFTRHLVYDDEFEGKYTLWEYNSCCNDEKPIMLILTKRVREQYEWKLFFTVGTKKDTIYGEAKYIKNKLKFYISNPVIASNYFEDEILPGVSVFNMEYDRYFQEKGKLYIGCFTRWDNYLKGYKNGGSLFAGIDYHFKQVGREDTFETTKEELEVKKQAKNSD